MKLYPTKGKNLVACGWENGILEVMFAPKMTVYRYKGVPQEVCGKLTRHPYPMKLYLQIVKGKFERAEGRPDGVGK